MKIVVNDIAASCGGALTILNSFYEYVKENDKENEYIFILSDQYIENTENIKIIIRDDVKKNGLNKMIFDFITGHKFINSLKPDYFLSLENILTFGVKCRKGVYIHQSIPFQDVKKFSFFKKEEFVYAIYQYIIGAIIRLSARKSDDVFVQTEWMRKGVSKKSRVDARHITVVPYENRITESAEKAHPKMNEFFYPATEVNVYKNQKCIYDACDILSKDYELKYNVTFTNEKPDDLHKYCSYCGFLEKEKLYDYYRNTILVFPSFIETIGLPLLEAKSANGMIFAADCPYAHEVLGNYNNAYFFDPMNPQSLSILMKKAITGQISNNSNCNYNAVEEIKTWENLLDIIRKK